MSASSTLSVTEALAELETRSPGVPFLALGQTIFWDEPMKGGILLASQRLGYQRKLVAGVHDTDYFAKLPSGPRQPGKFRALPHNDTTTKGLWSAAGEFSTLFGSETVITREALAAAGLRTSALQRARPGYLDEATEAWGWRGIVSLDSHPPVTADVPLTQVFRELMSTFDWAIDGAVSHLTGESRVAAERLAHDLRERICAASELPNQTLSDYYRNLLTEFYAFTAGRPVDLDATTTRELLRFNRQTWSLPRFALLRPFFDHRTAAAAAEAYDQSIRGSGLYGLSRFGTGAVPFDLIIPGHGRGTIRIGRRGVVIMTRVPQFLSLKRPLESLEEFAEILERKFGPNCTIVGKAVTLIGMLASEHVFVFHEGASGYVRHSRTLHQFLRDRLGWNQDLHPILRVRYSTWDSLRVCCSWFKLPEPFHRAFGTEELCAPSFAGRWKSVAAEQDALLETLGLLRRPLDLIAFLENTLGGSWSHLAREYHELHRQLQAMEESVERIRAERQSLWLRVRELKEARQQAERARGEHFRAFVFDQEPTPDAQTKRAELGRAVDEAIQEMGHVRAQIAHLVREQRQLVRSDEIMKIHERRRGIELEAELKRLRLIRHAIVSSRGLRNADVRPSAWWFRLVCPDGLWFRETVETAACYLEPLI